MIILWKRILGLLKQNLREEFPLSGKTAAAAIHSGVFRLLFKEETCSLWSGGLCRMLRLHS